MGRAESHKSQGMLQLQSRYYEQRTVILQKHRVTECATMARLKLASGVAYLYYPRSVVVCPRTRRAFSASGSGQHSIRYLELTDMNS